jgi:hypothetical protein
MKSLKDFLEARMVATGDFKISASGRKVRRLIKVGDDNYNRADDTDKDGDVDADDAKRKKMQGESVEVTECAPVAPVPARKYIKGTPENKELKAKSKPINGMPTNKMKEEVEHIEEATVKSQSYSWGTMKTVHHGKDFSIPLHPEHHKPIAALKHGESHSFKDETGNKWKATRDNDTVHFHGGSYGTQKTSVKHDTMKESVEITESSEHLVHVSDGSKYDEKPHPKDVEHVMSGVKKHNGEFDGHSDKGAYFKFKSHDDARSFKKHVDSCPNRSCHADLHESTEQVTEAVDKQDARLMQLARLGLLDKSDISLFRVSMQTLKADKQLSIKQRTLLLTVYEELISLVTGDDALFNRAKIDVQREGYYKDIDTNNKETERLSGSWKTETPWRKVKDTVTDKSGAKHGPMSRVRHLARLARAKSQEGK